MIKRMTIIMDATLHSRMRELSRRRRVQIGFLYEEAIKNFLNQDKNYMGENQGISPKGGDKSKS